jgi:hypothetical protein
VNAVAAADAMHRSVVASAHGAAAARFSAFSSSSAEALFF